jgi:hypothetical protein
MNPKVLFLLPGLLAVQCPNSEMPTMRALRARAVPTYEWPERRDLPEGDHPGHGEGSDESVMFVGINSNVSNTTSVTVDSGASGVGPYTSLGWLPKDLNLVTSVDQLVGGERFPTSLPLATNLNVSHNTTSHLHNPSEIKLRRSFTRRG